MTPHQWLDQALAELKSATIVDNLSAGLVKYCKTSRHDIVDNVSMFVVGGIEAAIAQVGWHDTILAACAYRGPVPMPAVSYRDNPSAGNDAQAAFLQRLVDEGLTADPPPANPTLPLIGLFAVAMQAAAAGDVATVDHIIEQLATARGLLEPPASGVKLIPPSVTWVKCPPDTQTGPSHYDPFVESQDRDPADPSRPWTTGSVIPAWFEGVPNLISQAKLQGIVADDPMAAARRPDAAADPGTNPDGCSWFKPRITDPAQWETILRSLVAAPGFVKYFADWKSKVPKAASRIGA